jgi:hypothetical protein
MACRYEYPRKSSTLVVPRFMPFVYGMAAGYEAAEEA